MRLRHPCPAIGVPPWTGTGVVVRLTESSEEVALELRQGGAPTDTTSGFSVEFIWKGTTFERMQLAMKTFAIDETSVSGYLYHKCALRSAAGAGAGAGA